MKELLVATTRDKSTKYVVALRGWLGISGATTAVVVPLFLEAGDQGIFFILMSLLALQYLAELGFSVGLISQVAANIDSGEIDSGLKHTSDLRVANINWLLRASIIWYGAGAILFLSLSIVGGRLLTEMGGLSGILEVQYIHILSACIATNILLIGTWAFFDGAQLITETTRIRLAGSVVGSFVLWAGLTAEHGVQSLIFSQVCHTALCAALTILRFGRPILMIRARNCGKGDMSWRTNILPFQGKLSISTFVATVTQAAFLPLAGHLVGVEAAGRIGLAQYICNGIQYFTASIIAPVAPVLANLFSSDANRKATAIWTHRTFATIVSAVLLLAFAYFLLFYVMPSAGVVADNLPSKMVYTIIAASATVTQILHCLAILCRAKCIEPFVPLTVVVSIGQITLVYSLQKVLGETGVVIALLASSVFSTIWGLSITYKHVWKAS